MAILAALSGLAPLAVMPPASATDAPAADAGGTTWSAVVAEGGRLRLGERQVVRYGAENRWVTRVLDGDVACSNEFFGADPSVGVVKSCQTGWSTVAEEGGSFTLRAESTLRFGTGTRWVARSVRSGPCTTSTFGSDPAVGVVKTCQAPATTVQTVAPAKVNASTSGYDYAPALMADDRYRMWWCTSSQGDAIGYSEADALGGPWTEPRVVLRGSGDPKTFDSYHTCDPSVIRYRGVHYMYYGGLNVSSTRQRMTAIGLASSPDGVTWRRENAGQPIVVPKVYDTTQLGQSCKYGAGQPSVAIVGGYFYMAYTDTTRGSRCSAGGVYLVRARDPRFSDGVEILTGKGFVPRSDDVDALAISGSASVELAYSDVLGTFVLAESGGGLGVVVSELDPTTFRRTATAEVKALVRRDGPALAKRPNGHLPLDPGDPTSLRLDVAHATGAPGKALADVQAWDLAVTGATLPSSQSPAALRATGRVPSLLEGYLLPAAGGAGDVVVGGQRVRFAVPSVAARVGSPAATVAPEWAETVPLAATVSGGQPAVRAPGRPGGFLIADGTRPMLLRTSCGEVVADNGSKLADVTPDAYASYALGPELFCRSPR